ncbi:hypothetical protein [Flavivirga eckloniae]|uniref:Uncharacterized protein n=1 Tax=Flavivirga eckloniae TaxID=1803846 RepID=A0A2K9PWL5_9FLAO|nr:hypothetical protein [Flavivirga eckloniae]AUP81472.1 hypothetical protein C1H87_23220 [Flavivirga eckloniae]
MKSLDYAPSDVSHHTFYARLLIGELNATPKQVYLQIVEKFSKSCIEGFTLEYSEIPFLFQQTNVLIPNFK